MGLLRAPMATPEEPDLRQPDPEGVCTTLVDKGESRRSQVLDAAADCFRQHGFHGTSIQRISKAAGMSPGHIYHYFRNKEAIVQGIVERNLEELLTRVESIRKASETSGIVDACLAQVDSGIDMRARRERVSLDLEILAEATRSPPISEMVRRADEIARGEFRALLKQLPSMSRLPVEELDARIAVMNTLFDGLVVRTLVDPSMDRIAVGRVIQRAMRSLLEVEPPRV